MTGDLVHESTECSSRVQSIVDFRRMYFIIVENKKTETPAKRTSASFTDLKYSIMVYLKHTRARHFVRKKKKRKRLYTPHSFYRK